MNELGIDKIDNLDLFGLSLVQGPALGADTAISEVATRSIKQIIETRTQGEKNMEQTENKSEPMKIDVDKLVSEKAAPAPV